MKKSVLFPKSGWIFLFLLAIAACLSFIKVTDDPAPVAAIAGANTAPSTGGPNIPVYYFPGETKRHLLVISGIHGSEAAGVEVAEMFLQRLQKQDAPKPYFSLIVVPVLFPENLASRLRATPGQPDPNRQMPAVGKDHRFEPRDGCYTDAHQRCMEPEVIFLLNLINHYKPERIASIHGHRNTDTSPAGLLDMMSGGGPSITTDPRPGHEKKDDALALAMALYADSLGVRLPANFLHTGRQTTRYPNETAIKASDGVSLGQWGSRPTPSRQAINVVTVETFGYENSGGGRDPWRWRELDALATTLYHVFTKP
ncbi:MAG: hypothetical protein IT259_12650 [Saprospiraceae bacterium]|nr:hypothetical protein [Saprospiraceae bacterium]